MLMTTSPVPFRKRQDIEREAEELLRKHNMYGAPVDPIRIAQAMNIQIFNAKFHDDTISGVLARRGPNITMLINDTDPAFRKRFTIAHELGHRVLRHFEDEADHTDKKGDLYRMAPSGSEDGSDRAEVQANMFAAALLMPSDFVRQMYKEEQDLDALARTFQVSTEAMANRLNSLGML